MAIVAYIDNYYYELCDKTRIKEVSFNELNKELISRSTLSDKQIFDKQSMYEVLLFEQGWPTVGPITVSQRFVNKMFIDVEKLLLSGSRDIVKNIANDFINYVKSSLNLYKFTMNDNDYNIHMNPSTDKNRECDFTYITTYNRASSSHYGDSYHIIFPGIYVYHNEQVKSFMNDFLTKHKDYINYVDLSVYTTRRLFRLPFCKNVSYNKIKKINDKDIHKPFNYDIKSDYSKYIIQLINPNGRLIYLSRRDPVNFVQRLKIPRGSGYLNRTFQNIVDETVKESQIRHTQITTQKSKQTVNKQENKDKTQQSETKQDVNDTKEQARKELDEVKKMIQQLLEKQKQLEERLK